MRWARGIGGGLLLASLVAGCGSAGRRAGPPPHAWVVAVNQAGRSVWRQPLTTRSSDEYEEHQPIAADGDGYFPEEGAVTALRLGDGHRTWSRRLGDSVDGMWPDGGLLVVLTDQVSDRTTRLWGLSRTTGAVRWKVNIGKTGIRGNPVATSAGTLVWLWGANRLQGVDLDSGKTRWTIPAESSQPVAAGGLVVAGRSGAVIGVNARTGAVRWTQTDVPGTQLQPVDNLIAVTNETEGSGDPNRMTALDPTNGQVRWSFDPHNGGEVSPLGGGRSGVLVNTQDPTTDDAWLLDPTTGQPAFRIGAYLTDDVAPLLDQTDLIEVEGLPTAGTALVDRSITTGAVRWRTPLRIQPIGTRVLRVGTHLLLVSGGPTVTAGDVLEAFDPTTGKQQWSAQQPESVTATPLTAGTLTIVQSSTLPGGIAD